MGVPYLVIGVLGAAAVLGVMVDMLFLRDADGVDVLAFFLRAADGVDVLLRRDEVGAGNFILATSPGPGGSREFLVVWRVERLVLRCWPSSEDV